MPRAPARDTGRAPLRPVSLAEVAGDYTYADIPIPKAAPL